MKTEFTKLPLHSGILITAENAEEAEDLSRWDNCVLSAKYNHDTQKDLEAMSLLIVKEV